jgi:hypothetical protein
MRSGLLEPGPRECQQSGNGTISNIASINPCPRLLPEIGISRLAECSQKHRHLKTDGRMLPETAIGRATKETDMDITKKAVVEPPKNTAPPVKAQPLPEHRGSAQGGQTGLESAEAKGEGRAQSLAG